MAPRRWTAAFACALLVPVLVLLAGRSAAAQDIQYGPYLTVERDHFQVNGTAKFLYFVSLFDAVREAALSPARLDEDLNYIKNTLRADGIRVMPNWLVYKDDSILTPTYVGPATDTLFDPSNPGALRASTLAALKLLLEHASSRNLIVDVSFTRETLPSPGMSSEQYQAALVMAARELKPYRNVLFDVQNEFTKNWPGASFDEKAGWMANLRRAVNAPDVDPFRIVVASVESTTAFDAGQFAAARAMGAVAFHDSRNASWYQETTLTQIGTGIRSGLGQTVLPIYLQEPTPWTSQDQAGNFTDAAKYAKEAGIAAWTFHQRAGFNLQTTSFKSRVSGTAVSNLKAELETVRWTVDSQTWGLDTTDEIDYYHLDPLGSVRAVTDQNQVVKERHDYLPFGEEYGATGGVETRRFTGKERDAETGLDYFGARSYMAPAGRFSTVDPEYDIASALSKPDAWNRYAYALNNPLFYVDPNGRDALWVKHSNGTATLVIPVKFVGTDATANTDAILARANQIKSLDPNVNILVIATDKPVGGVLNTMDYSQGFDTRHCGDIGECTYPKLGASHAHINSELPESVGAAVHDIFHFAGIDEGYNEGPRDLKGNRTSELKPGYTVDNIMSTRSGIELKADQLLQAKKNPTTKSCTSDDPREPKCAR